MQLRCAKCGVLHDIATLEPSLIRPDAYLAVPPAERGQRTHASSDFCVVRDHADARRWFVRVLVPVPVRGLARPCCWGIWCEVSAADYAKIMLLWNDPDQCRHAPFPATLANDIDGYPPTSALPGALRFVDPNQIPRFEFAPEAHHPFVDEVRHGVAPERVLEWLAPYLH